jgi:DNA-binding transcriptional ArsR family regulator
VTPVNYRLAGLKPGSSFHRRLKGVGRERSLGQAALMGWRIHFTDADLDKIAIIRAPGPLGETMLAVSFLRCPLQSGDTLRAWRQRARPALNGNIKPLAMLMPPGTRGLDVHTLVGEVATIGQGIGILLDLAPGDLLAELEFLDRLGRLPRQAWDVAEAGGRARLEFAAAIEVAYRALVEPYWPQISAQLRATAVSWERIAARAGPAGLLGALQSQRIRWRPPVLEIGGGLSIRDLHLDGRGIAIAPSVFAGRIASVHTDERDPAAPPRLRLPAADRLQVGQSGPSSPPAVGRSGAADGNGAALAALMGRTRAEVLCRIVGGCTTTELAGRCGISLAAASQHATVLRNAGLITTSRQGSAVLHALTALGEELLRAG